MSLLVSCAGFGIFVFLSFGLSLYFVFAKHTIIITLLLVLALFSILFKSSFFLVLVLLEVSLLLVSILLISLGTTA